MRVRGRKGLSEYSYTRLAGDGRTLTAEEAEERLHELLGTQPAKRTGSTIEDLGIWPLLLVEQGDSRRAPPDCMNEDNRTQLQDRLSGEIGQAAAGPLGQPIIELAWREYLRYYTASGQDGKVLRDARRALGDAREALAKAEACQSAMQHTADELAQIRMELQQLAPRLRDQRIRLAGAEHRSKQAAEARHALDLLEERVKNREFERDQVEETVRKHAKLASELKESRARHLNANKAIRSLQQRLEKAEERLRQHDASMETAQAIWNRAHWQLAGARKCAEHERLKRECDELGKRVTKAVQLCAQVRQLQDELASLPAIAPGKVCDLRKAIDTHQRAKARLEGAAATLILRALTDVSVNGELLRADEERKHSLVEENQFSIGHRLQIEIRPGGDELPRLKEAVADGDRAVSSAQADVGNKTLAEAEAYLQQCEALEQRIERQMERLRECVPKGIEFLEDELCALEEQLDSLDADANIGTAFDLGTAEHIEQEAHHALESVREQRDNTQKELV